MHEIRKNNEKEEVLLKLQFKMPTFVKVVYVFLIFGLVMTIVGAIIFSALFYLHSKSVKEWECEITNKRIKGTKGVLQKNSYSYRLDMIDNVEISKFLGVKGLKIIFSQGKNNTIALTNSNVFYISWVENIMEAYEKVSELLEGVKNEIDLQVDIEMKKIQVEEKKVEMFEKIANNGGSSTHGEEKQGDYIEQLERLNMLKEQGIITQEEYEKKKKKLLDI